MEYSELQPLYYDQTSVSIDVHSQSKTNDLNGPTNKATTSLGNDTIIGSDTGNFLHTETNAACCSRSEALIK